MKRMQFHKMVVLAVIMIFTGAGIALAHDNDRGRGGDRDDYGGHMMDYDGGYGGHMMGYGGGYGGHMMGYDRGFHGHMMGPDEGAYGPAGHNLSRNEYRQLENAREKFYNKTRELREKIDNKRYAIQREMNKENPNRHRIKSLQKELSALRAQFDQYSLDYDLAVRKALPDAARGRAYASGFRGGYGW
jgi:Spy/CpxP family protein refolding chaperone